jgi:transcriptional regulator with XRE-family HTH domain
MPKPPSLRRRRLVTFLKRLREEAGLNLADAAQRAGFSEAKLSRIETLKIMVSGDDTYTLATSLGADEATANALVVLARSAKLRGWWHVYSDDALGRFTDYIEMQSDATEIREFEEGIVPGALQTEGYTEAVLRIGLPDAPEETIKQRLAVRMELQEQARSSGLRFRAIIDEAALRRPVGGSVTMCAQLDALHRAALTPKIQIQVLPTDISGHPAMGTPFTLINLVDEATYVYLDNLAGGTYLEERRDIIRYESAWSALQAMAIDFDRSASLIGTIADEFRSHQNEPD